MEISCKFYKFLSCRQNVIECPENLWTSLCITIQSRVWYRHMCIYVPLVFTTCVCVFTYHLCLLHVYVYAIGTVRVIKKVTLTGEKLPLIR